MVKLAPTILAIVLFGCVTALLSASPALKAHQKDSPHYTNQNLKNALDIDLGSSIDEVEKIMGKPIFKDKKQELADININCSDNSPSKDRKNQYEAWHYCKTGKDMDEHVVIIFYEGRVKEVNNYSVSWLDLLPKGSKNSDAEPALPADRRDSILDCRLTAKWSGANSSLNK